MQFNKNKKIKIILLNKVVSITKFNDIKNKKQTMKTLKDKKIEELYKQKNVLIHYSYSDKLKKLFFYYLMGNDLVESIAKQTNNLIVEPIEFLVIKLIKRKRPFLRNYKYIFNFFKKIYYIEVKDFNLDKSKIYDSFNELQEKEFIFKDTFFDKAILSPKNNETLEVGSNFKTLNIEEVILNEISR